MATKARVIDAAGDVGHLVTDMPSGARAATLTVDFGDSQHAVVPHERLHVTDEGEYRLDGRFEEFEMKTEKRSEPDEQPPPDMVVAREYLHVERERRPIGSLLVHKRVNTEEITLDDYIDIEEAQVERVPVGQVVDAAPEVRRDGDIVIIPVLEERLVKQLVLVEEIRVHRVRHRHEVSGPVTLRHEHIDIEHRPTDFGDESGGQRPL